MNAFIFWLLFPYVLTAGFVIGFMTAPRWELAPVSRYKNLNEVKYAS